jgi:Trypsin
LPACSELDDLAGAEQLDSGIINGEPISTDEFPSACQIIFQGTLVMGQQSIPMTAPMCTGTLVASDVVIAAAHCVNEDLITMGFGEVEDALYCVTFEEDQTWMSDQQYQGNPPLPDDAVCGSHSVGHPDFDINTMVDGALANNNDVSLIFLDEPITDRPFAYMPQPGESDQIVEQMTVDIVGYGMETADQSPWNPDPNLANHRMWAETFINELGTHEMQIGDDATTGRKCHGDSGGPTYATLDTDFEIHERVIGITSRAYLAQEDCNIGGVDMRVDAFLDWFEDEMINACDEGWRTDCDEPGIPVPPTESTGDDDAADDDDDDDDAGLDDDDDGGEACQCRVHGPGLPPAASATAILPLLLTLLALRRR